MPIYDISEHKEDKELSDKEFLDISYHMSEMRMKKKEDEQDNHLFSAIASRLFFFILLIADVAWGIVSILLLTVLLLVNLITAFKILKFKQGFYKKMLNIKRSFVCGVSLFMALFSPALGTMFACSYFLMYDKNGIEEVVPSVLQDQFREFLNQS